MSIYQQIPSKNVPYQLYEHYYLHAQLHGGRHIGFFLLENIIGYDISELHALPWAYSAWQSILGYVQDPGQSGRRAMFSENGKQVDLPLA